MHNNLFISILFLTVTTFATDIVRINNIRGEYELDFSNVYEVPIFPDIETMISFPPGYRITLAMPGSPDFVSATVIQNTVYLTRPVDHEVETNVALHVISPEGIEEKLMIRCIGPRRGSAKVLAVHFTQPNTSEVNRVVETMKARYTEQLNQEMSQQEKELKISIHKESMANARAFFVKAGRKSLRKGYKGAEVFLDGIINNRNSTYIYMISSVKNGNCDIISLEKLILGKRAAIPELIEVKQLSANEFYYCWSVPLIQIPKKPIRIKFNLKIWSKSKQFSAKIS